LRSKKRRRQEGKGKGVARMGREAMLCLLLQGTLWEKPFRKGKGQATGGTPCLLVPDYWTFLRKEDNRERKRVKRKGKKARLCPFIARGRCGRNLLEREKCKRQGGM